MSPNNAFDYVGSVEAARDAGEVQEQGRDGLVDFDTAVGLTGYGRFHYKVVSVCALCLLTNGVQNGLSSYVFSAAQCDLHLTSAQLGFLNVSFLIGGIASAFLWGAVADLCGRRKVLLISLALDFAVTLTSSTMSSFPALATCRCLNGFLIGAAGSITFNYIAEFHAPQHRTKSVCYSGVFFTAAWLLLPTLAYLIIPLPTLNLSNGFYLSSWRLFLIIIAIPELIAAVWLYFTPESPKFLAERGFTEEALKILREMYASNKGKDGGDFPVKFLETGRDNEKSNDDVVCIGRVKRMLGEMVVQTRKLFRMPILYITVLVCTIMFCNMFGYFGLGLWLPELFVRFELFQEQFPNKTVTVKHLASLKIIRNDTCTSEFNTKLFQNTLCTGAASFLGNFISGWLSGKVSIKLVPLVTMLIGSLASGVIYWLRSSLQNLIIACIFQASMATANVAIGSVAVELFPTSVAAMALCLTLFIGRMGAAISNVVFGLLMDSHCEIPIILVSVILLLGTLLCFFIPTSSVVKTSSFNWFTRKRLHIDIAVISTGKARVDD